MVASAVAGGSAGGRTSGKIGPRVCRCGGSKGVGFQTRTAELGRPNYSASLLNEILSLRIYESDSQLPRSGTRLHGTKILSQASETEGWHRSSLQGKLKKLDKAIEEILQQTEQAGSDSGGENRLPEPLQ